MRWKSKSLICFWLSYVVFLSSAWKNVGMTIACHRRDVKQSLFEIFFPHRKAVSRDLFIYVHIHVFSASLSYSWTIIISTHTPLNTHIHTAEYTHTPLNTHTHICTGTELKLTPKSSSRYWYRWKGSSVRMSAVRGLSGHSASRSTSVSPHAESPASPTPVVALPQPVSVWSTTHQTFHISAFIVSHVMGLRTQLSGEVPDSWFEGHRFSVVYIISAPLASFNPFWLQMQ